MLDTAAGCQEFNETKCNTCDVLLRYFGECFCYSSMKHVIVANALSAKGKGEN